MTRPARSPAGKPGRKILVVDDDTSILEILSTQLARLNYTPCTASNGREAVKAFKKHKPDAVVLDVMMPDMDGFTACEKMRALEKGRRRTPIIFLTARESPQDKLAGTLSGGDDFVVKPVSLQDLRERIETALERAAKKSG